MELLRPADAVDGAATATSTPGCIQFDDGGAYTAPAGPLSLTVTVQGGPDATWHGLRDGFDLLRAPCLYLAAGCPVPAACAR